MSTRTPPLTRRMVLVGVTVVVVVLMAVNAGVYVALRASLLDALDELLADRADTVRLEQLEIPAGANQAEALAQRLQARGLRVAVQAPDGTTFRSEPSSPVISGSLPPPGPSGDEEYTSRQVPLQHGLTAVVFARTSGVTRTLHQLLALQVLTSLGAVAAAALLLSRASTIALRPIRDIAAAAGRTAAGKHGERLRPDRPDTELGQMATAYDQMLDSLEAGMEVAASIERRRDALETRYRQVLEAAQEAYIAVNAAGEVVEWNPRAEALFGWSRAEMVDRPAIDLVLEPQREAVAAGIAELALQGPVALGPPYELAGITRSGRPFTAECTVWGVDRRSGTVVHAFVRDITRRREAEQNAARLVAIIEGSSDAIITQGLDGRIQTWNDAAEHTYGWSAAEAVGQHMSLIVPTQDRAHHAELLSRIGKGEPVVGYEGERLTRGGTVVPVSERLSPVRDADGRVVAASSIARDITEERFLADTLDATLLALERALDEATASEGRTRQFLADAAHQLRTPMAGIRACSETLLRGVPDETADELLAMLVRETSRAARLVTALLEVARLDQDLGLQPAQCDVVEICRDEVERARVLAPHLDVQLVVAQAAPPSAPLDPKALHEVLANLVDNSRRHATSEVVVHIEASSRELRIRVCDDGPGVAPELQDRIFQRFVSLDGQGGSGLGLPIARGYARALGGDLTYGDGFVLTLPLEP